MLCASGEKIKTYTVKKLVDSPFLTPNGGGHFICRENENLDDSDVAQCPRLKARPAEANA